MKYIYIYIFDAIKFDIVLNSFIYKFFNIKNKYLISKYFKYKLLI